MGMGFATTWLRQVSTPASHDHFNHYVYCTDFAGRGEIGPVANNP